MYWTWILAAALPALFGLSAARADIPLPRPRPQPAPANVPANFAVMVNPNAREARLLIPKKIANRKAGLEGPGDQHLTDADNPAEAKRPWQGTIVAGVSLALAVACAGVWLVRRGRARGHGLILLLIGCALAGGSALAWANAPPPPPPPPAQPQALFESLKVTVEFTDEGDTVTLVLPPETARTWTRSAAAAPPAGARPNSLGRPE